MKDTDIRKFFNGEKREPQQTRPAPTFEAEYELALRVGNRRFGSACEHAVVKNGTCVSCLRRVY